MRIEPKQAFYNDDTGAVQPWKDIEVTDAVGNKLVAEGLVREIEGGGGGGYDAVLSIYHDEYSDHDYVITIESGSYADIKEKTMANEPPVILAKVWDVLAGYRGATTMTAIYLYPSSAEPTIDFVFTVKMPSTAASTHTAWWGLEISWNSNDEVSVF